MGKIELSIKEIATSAQIALGRAENDITQS
jgi:hypothetical protein